MKKNFVTDNFISTPRTANYGNLDELTNNENPQDFVVQDGNLVPASQVNPEADNYISTSAVPNFSTLDEVARTETPEAFVVRNGELVPESQVNQQSDDYIKTSPVPNFAGYWYESNDLFLFEQHCMAKAKKDFGPAYFDYGFKMDKARKQIYADVTLSMKLERLAPRVKYCFKVYFDNNHPARGSNGTFGGSIKIYPVSRNNVDFKLDHFKHGSKYFEHVINDRTNGGFFICQRHDAPSSEVNCYHAMQNAIRWIEVYEVFRKTGVDIDAGKAA